MEQPKLNNLGGRAFQRGKKIEGRCANYFKVGHNAFEFILDFAQYYPESEETEVCARIIISPGCAKELFIILGESIEQYVENFKSPHDE